MINKKGASLLQIVLLVAGVFATTHLAGVVIADDISDILRGDADVYTCIETVDGSVCQHFQEAVCDVICRGDCVRGERTSVPDCEAGVCIDDDEGICSAGATRRNCDERGGRFVEGAMTDVAECNRHCCILGNEAQFVTEDRCRILSRELGIETNFDTSFFSADLCSMFAKQEELGACTWPSVEEGKFECKFTSLSTCLQTIGSQADFHDGLLCSNDALDSICEKQN
ncbi:MAG: hypothetical protein ABIH92_02625, partial [Nanoarchaeota archaeon]